MKWKDRFDNLLENIENDIPPNLKMNFSRYFETKKNNFQKFLFINIT
jgi:hypothetical protein